MKVLTLRARRGLWPALAIALLATVLAPTLAHAAAGDLDPSFGGDGRVTTAFGGFAEVYGVAIDSQGRIVASGRDSAGFALARYKANGALDPSFSFNGKVRTAFRDSAEAHSVTIDAQGRIVAAGLVRSPDRDPSGRDFALARYNPNGSLDDSFSTDGKVRTDFGGTEGITSVAIDSQGRIVAVGQRGHRSRNFPIARYVPTGSLDPSFSGDGKVLTAFGTQAYATSVAIDSQDGIVAAGTTRYGSDIGDFALARYNQDGSLDSSWSGDGRKRTDFGGQEVAQSVAIDSQGRILAAGFAAGFAPNGTGFDFALARYNQNGGLDGSFGTGGKVTTDFGVDTIDRAMSVATDSQGRIIAVGITQTNAPGGQDFGLARYAPNGSPDASFSGNGRLKTSFGGYDRARSGVIDSQDRIVAAGETQDGAGNEDFALARYIG
jgi:uncharacterized delta-60 repeat protein